MEAFPLGPAPTLAELEATSRSTPLGGAAAQQKIMAKESDG